VWLGEDARVNWARAVHHVEAAAVECQRLHELPTTSVPVQVTQLWAIGDVLGPRRDLEVVTVALGVDLPVDEVPWRSHPPAVEHWLRMTRLPKNPVRVRWRSARAPLWNHEIRRPLLVWEASTGLIEEAMVALRDGHGEAAGLPEPTAEELTARVEQELAISLATLRARAADYGARQWGPTKLGPTADALWHAAEGYLDLLDARSRL
jgi:hypothetical protein